MASFKFVWTEILPFADGTPPSPFYRRLFGDVVASAVVFPTISHMLILLY